MIYLRNQRFLKRGIGILLATVALNATGSFLARRAEAARSGGGLNVDVKVEESFLGHNSIGIDESSLQAGGGQQFLHFTTLEQWNFRRDAASPCPEGIQRLNGKRFSSVGFMYPLESGDKVKSFCLLRSTQTCCYGPRPQYNQYLLVESATPVSFDRLAPVLVSGTFFVEPKPDDGYIYRMAADSVRKVEDDTPQVDPATAAQRARLPLFEFEPLLAMGTDRRRKVPDAVRALSGKKVVVSGFCVSRSKEDVPRLMLGKYWWDGFLQGTAPTVYNSLVVFPSDRQQVPPVWRPDQVFTGTLRVNDNPASWSHEGIVQLRDADLGVPGVTAPRHVFYHSGIIPGEIQLALLAVVLIGSFGIRKRDASAPQPDAA